MDFKLYFINKSVRIKSEKLEFCDCFLDNPRYMHCDTLFNSFFAGVFEYFCKLDAEFESVEEINEKAVRASFCEEGF